MDSIPGDIFKYPPDTRQSLRKQYGLEDIGIFRESINHLQEWINKQDHFVKKNFDENHLEWTLIASKGSLERAKQRLDKYCTGKILHARMFQKLDAKKDFHNFHQYKLAFLPKFDEDFYRVLILKLHEVPDVDSYLDLYRYGLIMAEYLRGTPLNGIIVIVDYREVNAMELISRISVPDIRQFVSVIVDCFALRLKGIHLIMSSNVIELIIIIAKQVLSEKLTKRLFVHKSYEALHDFVLSDVLPVEYGGKEKSLAELNEMWHTTLGSKTHVEYMKKMQEFRTDESRRHILKFNEEYMGTPGSFRSFVVD